MRRFFLAVLVLAVGAAYGSAADLAAWQAVPQSERDAYNAAQERVRKGETVVFTTGPHGIPGLKAGTAYRCYLVGGQPHADEVVTAACPTCPGGVQFGIFRPAFQGGCPGGVCR